MKKKREISPVEMTFMWLEDEQNLAWGGKLNAKKQPLPQRGFQTGTGQTGVGGKTHSDVTQLVRKLFDGTGFHMPEQRGYLILSRVLTKGTGSIFAPTYFQSMYNLWWKIHLNSLRF